MYRVGYTGNTSTRADAAEDLTLLRAADVTMQNGYTFFMVEDKAKRTNVSSSYTPMMPYVYKGSTYYTGGYSTSTYTPESEITIHCYVQRPLDTREMIYEAQQVKANLGAKYIKVKGKNAEPAKNKDAVFVPPAAALPPAVIESGVSAADKADTENAFKAAMGG